LKRKFPILQFLIMALAASAILLVLFDGAKSRSSLITPEALDFRSEWKTGEASTTFPTHIASSDSVVFTALLPDDLPPGCCLFVRSAGQQVSLKVGGRMISGYSTPDDGPFPISCGTSWAAFEIPADSSGAAAELTVYPNGSSCFIELDNVLLGSGGSIRLLLFARSLLSISISFLLLLVAAAMLISVLLLAMGFQNIRLSSSMFLWTGVFALCTSAWIFSSSDIQGVLYLGDQGFFLLKLFSYMLMLMPCLMLVRSSCPSFSKALSTLALTHCAACIWTLLTLCMGIFRLSAALGLINALMCISTCAMLAACVREYRGHRSFALKLTLAGTAALAVMTVASVVCFYVFSVVSSTAFYTTGIFLFVLALCITAVRTVFSSIALSNSLENLASQIPCGICRSLNDEQETIVYANDYYYKMFGYTREEAAAAGFTNVGFLIYPPDLPAFHAAHAKSGSPAGNREAECREVKKNGEIIWVLARGHISDDGCGDTLAVVVDITDRKRAEEALRISEEEYRIAARQSGKFITRYDVENDVLRLPPEAAKTFGCEETLNNAAGRVMGSGLVAAESIEEFSEFLRKITGGESTGSTTLHIKVAGDGYTWYRFDFTTVDDGSDEPRQCVISFSDVTKMREKELAYEKWQQSYHLMPHESMNYYEYNLTMDIFDREEGGMLPHVPGSTERTMSAVAQYLAEHCTCADDRAKFLEFFSRERLLSCYGRGIRYDSMEYMRLENGAFMWTNASLQLVPDPYSSDVKCFFLLKDIDKSKRSELIASARSQQDPLTGLLNRAAFIEKMNCRIAECRPGMTHALIMIDIDGFKRINDTFGHHFGDQVLCDIAASLRSTLRANDLVGRIGGDEFVVCLLDLPTDGHVLERRADFMCGLLDKNYGSSVAVSGSLGISVCPMDGCDFDTLYQKADKALYKAKGLGKRRYVVYTPELENAAGNNAATPIDAPTPSDPAYEHRSPTQNFVKTSAVRRILIADDSEANRAILAEIFGGEYETLEAADGDAALLLMRQYTDSIAAVLLDIIMPRKSGFEVLEEINEDSALIAIPVIVISAGDDSEYSARAIELGAADFVQKPIDPELVKLRVGNAMKRRELEELRSSNRLLLAQKEQETRSNMNLVYIAEHDPLTDVYNKNAFLRLAADMIAKSPATSFAIAMVDVDRLKIINDIFGHDAGDKLLRHIAGLLREYCSGMGLYARVESDNFALCLPGGQDAAADAFSFLNSRIAEYDLSFEILLSCGVYVSEGADIAADKMLDRAQIACKTVKGNYVRRFAVYNDDMRAKMIEEQTIVSQMNAALEGGQFVVWLQPKCRLDDGRIVGAEALVRWMHPEKGMVMPGKFIPIFENNGFIMRLDEYIWEETCKLLRSWLDSMPNGAVPVSVNISRVDIYNPSLCSCLTGLIEKYHLPARMLELEITESAYTEEPELLSGVISQLRADGFKVGMDDFGSGYSSLNMLKDMPVDELKIDMRFVSGSDMTGRGGSILTSVLDMTKQLELPALIEGVETEQQALFLRGIGCDVAQGYYFHRPMPVAEFEKLLSDAERK